MAKALPQILFDFTEENETTGEQEFLSGRPIPVPQEKPKGKQGRKSLKALEEEADRVNVPPDEELFQKQYYAIGEVAQMFNVKGSLLRFWEKEFDLILRKNRKGDRFFTPKDIKTIQLIHDLVRRRKFTIEGAKDYIKNGKRAEEKYEMIQSLQRMRMFLLELKAHL
jgi:DNA-binding transcriptional MerR regulator